jgi:uncharacterized protein YbjT (DUF2867 family)
MNLTAIVFGATGLTGNYVVCELFKNPDFKKVKVVTRFPIPLSDAKLEQIVLSDFEKLSEYTSELKGDVIFCCLGTTIKKVGTPEAFRKVDLEYPVAVASIGQANGVGAMVVVSSIGADASSKYLYLRTKGEMENKIREIFTGDIKIFRPSMLLGHRGEMRFAEEVGKMMMYPVNYLLFGKFRKYRSIHALAVAKAMVASLSTPKDKIVFESDEIADLAGKIARPNYKPFI